MNVLPLLGGILVGLAALGGLVLSALAYRQGKISKANEGRIDFVDVSLRTLQAALSQVEHQLTAALADNLALRADLIIAKQETADLRTKVAAIESENHALRQADASR